MEINLKETIGAILGFIAVWLATRQNPLYWLISIFSIILYGFVLYENKLYSDMFLHITYLIFSIYGFYNWTRKNNNIKILSISSLSSKSLYLWILIILISGIVIGFIFHSFTNADIPYIDSFCTAASLVGTYWQAKKKIENWPLWIIVNTIYIGIYIHKHLYITSILYLLYIFLAIVGWRKWSLALNSNKKQ